MAVTPPPLPDQRRIIVWLIGLLVAVLMVLSLPPFNFPAGGTIEIAAGRDVTKVGRQLAAQGVIRSPTLFRLLVGVLGPGRGVLAGNYIFEQPLSVFTIAGRLTRGFTSVNLVRLTLPEGLSNEEMAAVLANKFPNFDRQRFLTAAARYQGELFPDTYFFPPTVTENAVLAALRANFAVQMEPWLLSIEASGRSLGEVLTMASLVEKEAHDLDDRRLIAGILWRRLDVGMPLQVDAVFPYLVGRNSFEVTVDDLALDSPHNTYRYPGLPPGPIVNPGLAAIEAVLTPTDSDYWFYLSDRRGRLYFAETFDEHKLNKQHFLQ